ncbi:hypothetical protein C4Q31_10480 [Leptospira borgpetersenii serovar Ceylonica]|nr:hypothetical protein C4Q31_10480 [Leptospira borgpetersenii serovar Ceylonica]EKQ93416.1 hypothetical protein LEP1GSC101_0009 [Leptospira borgpetersenii str. UI 09149]
MIRSSMKQQQKSFGRFRTEYNFRMVLTRLWVRKLLPSFTNSQLKCFQTGFLKFSIRIISRLEK